MYKLMAGDVELAEKMAKREGLPFEDCLKAVAEVNALNTPSYLGGDMIRKGDSSVKKQKKLRKRFAEMAVQTGVAVPLLNHIERVEKSLGGEYWEWADGYYNGRRQLNDVRFNTRAPSRW